MVMVTNVPEGYKQTKVGLIPNDWQEKRLEDVSKLSSGTTPSRKLEERYYLNGNIYWVKTTDLNNSNIIHTEEKVTELALNETCLKEYSIGTVLVAMYGGFNQIGRTGLLKIPAAVNQALIAIQPQSETLDSIFLINYLNFRVSYWKSVAISSRKDPNLTSRNVKEFPIPLPPLSEQQAIAQALSDADAAIAELDRLITKKRNIKQGAMQQLLTGKKRLPGFNSEWEIEELGNISLLERGKFSARPRNDPKFFGGDIPFIQTGDVTKSNGLIKTYTQSLNHQGLRVSKLFPPNTLFFTIAANIGDIGIASFQTACTDSLIAITPQQKVDKKWLFYVLKSRKKVFESLATQNAQLNINLEKLKPYLLLVPPLPEQQAIAQVLTDMDAEIEALEQKRDKYKAIKQGMMQELLTGRTRLV